MVRKRNRLLTDAVREVRHTFSRFLSILVLSALAVAFLSGLRTAAPDMEYTADNYYDRTHLMDGYVISTLGITDGDLAALAGAAGIEDVEGVRTVDAVATDATVTVRAMPVRLNLLETLRGRQPERADECVTEELILAKLGLDIGDTLELSLPEDSGDALSRTRYTIVGTVNSPLYAGTDRGSTSLGNGSVAGFVYVPGENFTADYYTVAYFTGTGLRDLYSYGDEYEDRMTGLVDSLDDLADERAQARYDEITGEARDKIDEAQAELDDKRAEVYGDLDDAERQLDDARQQLDDGWADYRSGKAKLDREIAEGRRQLADAKEQLDAAQAEFDAGLAQYEEGQAAYENGLARYEENRAAYEDGMTQYGEGLAQYEEGVAQLEARQAQLDEAYAQYDAALEPYVGTPYYDAAVAAAAEQKAQLDAAQGQIDDGFLQLAQSKGQLDAVKSQLDEARTQLDAAKAQLEESKAQLDAAKAQLDEAGAQIESGRAEYTANLVKLDNAEQDGLAQLADALDELNQGEADYAEGLAEYEDGRSQADEKLADAQAKLDDARAELAEVEPCEWYVLGRNTNVGFVSYAQDAERVSNLANVFPLIFFLVAALACLTTMTRMVEDHRTEIGAMKALGFSRLAISVKYLGYAFLASLTGGLIGLAVGCTAIPAVIANAFAIMYHIPGLDFKPQVGLYIAAVAAAVVCTTGAALWACLSTLVDTPANLMRPKAPKAGRRVLLERIGPLWRRLSFTWKVTVRNLFRYQRRFWMTVIGIGGCTALIVTGFGLHDSIFSILDKQFDQITVYDASVGLNGDITGEQRTAVEDYLAGNRDVSVWLPVCQENVDASAGALGHSAALFALDDQTAFRRMVDLRERKSGAAITVQDEGVVITEKLSELLDVSVGDSITIENDGRRVSAPVTGIAENYVKHYIYLTEGYYQQLFGAAPQENSILLAFAGGVDAAAKDDTSVALMKLDGVGSYSNIATLRDTFENSMSAINYAVVIIIAAAAALAFVVLYNLTNINITERMRELATLKVLGFYDREVSAYVYRENIFLTLFGIVLGLVMGRFLHGWMVTTVEVDIAMFGRTAPAYAYVIAAALTVVFSALVNVAAHFRLKKVDMVESLKTVE